MARALITNDDGIDSPGLWALAAAARDAGLEVVVAAPHRDSSGVGTSVLSVQDDGRTEVHARELPGLSGINVGANVGHAVLHSGTVGAALTASRHGWRGLAVFLETAWQPPERLHWDTAVAVLPAVLPGLLAARAGTVLSLNVPDRPVAALR